MMKKRLTAVLISVSVTAALIMSGCADTSAAGKEHVSDSGEIADSNNADSKTADEEQSAAEASSQEKTTYDNSEDGGHAITADGETAAYSSSVVTKSGDSEGDEADFYGENAAVFATNAAHLTLSDMDITTDGAHANAVFSYGEGTVVDISDSTINTSGNCSGGLMTTGGGTMNASNLTIHTTGNSSAAIRSDRGGGTVSVTGGEYITDGKGSPAVYSTADITVNDALLQSTTSEGIVVEGKNSVTLNNVTLTADHNKHNSDKSDNYHAVMIYQSMSGDADAGLSKFSANGGSITNANGDIFFVNNTATDISLSGVEITNNGDGVFLRSVSAGWGNEGSNGGKVNLTADSQKIDGDMIVDDISALNLYLKEGSTFNGAINPDGTEGDVYVELSDGSKWILTDDSHISSLTCDTDSIDLNGHTLYIDGKAYAEGTEAAGDAIEIKADEDVRKKGDMSSPPDDGGRPDKQGGAGQPHEGEKRSSGSDKEPPAKPDGDMSQKPEGEPPAKPDENPVNP